MLVFMAIKKVYLRVHCQALILHAIYAFFDEIFEVCQHPDLDGNVNN